MGAWHASPEVSVTWRLTTAGAKLGENEREWPLIYPNLVVRRSNSPATKGTNTKSPEGDHVMAQPATQTIEKTPIQPAATAIDRGHLAHMTFGDRSLEREVLQLFDRQAGMLMTRMRASEPPAVATLAHTIKGSALGVGAVNVARAAATAEFAATLRGGAEMNLAVDRLAAAVDEARATIAALLHAH